MTMESVGGSRPAESVLKRIRTNISGINGPAWLEKREKWVH